jgi:hypothetical protein
VLPLANTHGVSKVTKPIVCVSKIEHYGGFHVSYVVDSDGTLIFADSTSPSGFSCTKLTNTGMSSLSRSVEKLNMFDGSLIAGAESDDLHARSDFFDFLSLRGVPRQIKTRGDVSKLGTADGPASQACLAMRFLVNDLEAWSKEQRSEHWFPPNIALVLKATRFYSPNDDRLAFEWNRPVEVAPDGTSVIDIAKVSKEQAARFYEAVDSCEQRILVNKRLYQWTFIFTK